MAHGEIYGTAAGLLDWHSFVAAIAQADEAWVFNWEGAAPVTAEILPARIRSRPQVDLTSSSCALPPSTTQLYSCKAVGVFAI
jgi:hypothetical protein